MMMMMMMELHRFRSPFHVEIVHQINRHHLFIYTQKTKHKQIGYFDLFFHIIRFCLTNSHSKNNKKKITHTSRTQVENQSTKHSGQKIFFLMIDGNCIR